MRFVITAFVSICCFLQGALAQDEGFIKRPISHKSFNKNNGLPLDLITSLALDNDGWLWIGGVHGRAQRYKNENNRGLLYRFNGSFFQKVDLPERFTKNFRGVDISKISDQSLLVTLLFNDDLVIYYLDVNTLKFTKSDLPIGIPNDFPNLKITEVDDGLLLLVSSKSTCKIYRFKSTGEVEFITEVEALKEGAMKHIATYEEVYFFGNEGDVLLRLNVSNNDISTVKVNDVEPDNQDHIANATIANIFRSENLNYFHFNFSPYLFTYNEKTNNWQRSEKFAADYNSRINTDAHENLLVQKQTDEGIEIVISESIDSKPSRRITLPNSYFVKVAGNNFNKKVYLASRDKLNEVIYSSSNVSTYLPDFSIRSILHINDNRYLVGTESNGLFEIDVLTEQMMPLQLTLDNNPYTPLAIRSLFFVDGKIWSNDNHGLISFTLKDKSITSYPSTIMTSIAENSDFIYGGTSHYHLVRFDKKRKRSTFVDRTDTLNFSDLHVVDSTVFGATNKGLYKFESQTSRVLKVSDNERDNYILCIVAHPDYGLLLGTQSGKVLAYDKESDNLNLIYEDDLDASIADILTDDHDNLWINTFAGIVKFNPNTETEIRFDQSEGFSHFESNRFSSLKTEDGHFFVGTLKGLNYFHPDSIELFENQVTLKKVSLQYYEPADRAMKTILNNNMLSDLSEVTLVPENRNLSLEFALFGNETAETASYQYTLDGETWQNVSAKNRLDLINLAPGTYDLKIKAQGLDREQIGNLIELKINAQEFFYKTRWFIALVITTLMGIASYLILESKKRQRLQEVFSQQIIESSEQQKANIARELHDSVGQKLVLLSQNADRNSDAESKSLIGATLNEVRNISKGLHPSIIDRLGATSAINNLINETDENTNLFVQAEIEQIDGLLDVKSELHIYRIIQEALGNIIKHAEAQSVEVRVKNQRESILIRIADNGKGYVAGEKLDSGLGMRTLKERAAIINSKLQINSTPGKGTIISLSVPLVS